jgi:hypothetical protein
MFPQGTLTTNDAKAAQDSLLFVGKPDATLRVMAVGSCRALPYLNYMAAYNRFTGKNVFYAGYVNPADLRTTVQHKPQDHLQAAERLVKTPSVARFLSGVEVLLCEHVESYGALNTNARDVGIRAHLHSHTKVFIVPNWNAMGVLRDDIYALVGHEHGPGGVTSESQVLRAAHALEKFYRHCALSSFPEMALAFDEVWKTERWFWTHNHVARPFTEFIFSQWLLKMGLDPMPADCLSWTRGFDLFASSCTTACQQDVDVLGLRWPV